MLKIRVLCFIATIVCIVEKGHAEIEFVSSKSSGTGCPAGSVHVALTPSNSIFSILYDQMTTTAAGIRAEQRKNCDTTINLKIPSNMQLELEYVRYTGFMGLENAASWGYVNSRAYFNGGTVQFPGQAPRRTDDKTAPILRFFQSGPLESNFSWTGEYNGTHAAIRSPCGVAIVRVRAEVITSIGPEGGSGMTSLDATDGIFSQLYKVRLKNCN